MSKLLALILASLIVFCLPAIAHSPKTATFDGSLDEVFDAAVRTAQSDWSVTFADRKTGTISFATGTSFTSNGMECSASLQPMGGRQVVVTLKTQKKNGQIIAWGVGDRIASKFFEGIKSELGADPPLR